MLDKAERRKLVGQSGGEATQSEAQAVADAIGLNERVGALPNLRKDPSGDDEGYPLTKVASVKSDYNSGPESPSPTGALGPDDSMGPEMSNTEFERLDSPGMSEEDEEEIEEEEPVDVDGEPEEKAHVEAARRMLEAGEGLFLKSRSELLIEDDT